MDDRIYNLIRLFIICTCVCVVSYFLLCYIVHRDILKEKERYEQAVRDVMKLSPLYDD